MSLDIFLTKHKERIIGLDIMRSLAILIVIFDHSLFLLPEATRKTVHHYNPIPFDGVSIFFVLSGYLVGGILLKTIDTTNFGFKDLFSFWVRRWFRTIPNYLLVLVFILIAEAITNSSSAEFQFRYLFFLQNFITPTPNFYPEAWSLSVEEWFYLLFPICCYCLQRFTTNKLNAVLISTCLFLAGPFLFRLIKYQYGMGIFDIDETYRKIVVLRLDSLMFGVLAAYMYFRHAKFWTNSRYFLLALGFGAVILFNLFAINYKTFYAPLFFTIESLAIFCFLPFLGHIKTTNFRIADAFFISISLISYSMYLLNYTVVLGNVIPFINKLAGINNIPGIINIFLFLLITLTASYFLYRFFEKPVMQLRERIKFNH